MSMFDDKRRILIVDDNPSIHDDLKHILLPKKLTAMDAETIALENELFDDSGIFRKKVIDFNYEFEIDDAFQGKEAINKIEKAEREGCPYSMVFMDVRMPPGIDGIQTIQKVWEKYPETEIIIVTAYSDYSFDEIIKKLGSTDNLFFMKKPFDHVVIRQAVTAITKKLENAKKNLIQINDLEAEIEVRKNQLSNMLSLLENKKSEIESKVLTRGGHLPGFDYQFRTPMHGIMGMTDLLLDTDLNEDQRSYAESIKASSDSLYTSINDIMDYSRLCAGMIELIKSDFNIRTLIEEIVDYIDFSIVDKNLKVVMLIEANVPEIITGDRSRVRQILLNLATNAVNFTESGEITLNLGCDRMWSDGEDKANSPDQVLLRFQVTDTGIGISPEKIDKLFPAHNLNKQEGLTGQENGIGLAISRSLAHLMKGEMGAESVPGQGSTFWFTAQFNIVPASDFKYQRSHDSIEGLNCLIVGDNATSRKVLSLYINKWGGKCSEASHPSIAIERLHAALNIQAFDIVVADFKNSDPQTYAAFATSIKRYNNLKDLKLVAITSTDNKNDIDFFKLNGYGAILSKPIKQNHLYECLLMLKGAYEKKNIFQHAEIITNSLIDAISYGRYRVLLLEENISTQKEIVYTMKKMNIICDVANNAETALTALTFKNYDIIMIGNIPPSSVENKNSVLEVINATQKKKKRIPIISLVADEAEKKIKKDLHDDIDEFIVMPLNISSIKAILNKWSK